MNMVSVRYFRNINSFNHDGLNNQNDYYLNLSTNVYKLDIDHKILNFLEWHPHQDGV